MEVRKIPRLNEDFRGASNNQIELVSAKKITAVGPAAKAALTVNTAIAEIACPSGDIFVVDLDKSVEIIFSAKAIPGTGFAAAGDEKDF